MIKTLPIDEILNLIEQNGFDKLSSSVSNRDKRILKNLVRLAKMPEFLTEAQGNLLLKILKENLESLNFIGASLIPSLKAPSWTKPFRVIKVTRKIYITKQSDGTPYIIVECPFNKDTKKSIATAAKNIEGPNPIYENGCYQLMLTEKNLVSVVDSLKKYNFEKSEEIEGLYDKISKIDRNEYLKEFSLLENKNEKLKRLLNYDVLDINKCDPLLLEDRKIKFQYNFSLKNTKFSETSLEYKIATRTNHKIFLNNENFSLMDISVAIKNLRRLPVLVIFDEYQPKKCIENLKSLKTCLDALGVNLNVGVYFRFSSDSEGAEFNTLVNQYGYNKQLDKDNKVSVVSNGKLPKFFLKNQWYPKSVISFSNQFRNNKTSVYCNECDLVLYYNNTMPVIGTVDEIV